VIKNFKHKALERFFRQRDASRIQVHLAPRVCRMLDALDEASVPEELDVPGWFLHRLSGDRKHLRSLRVSGNWRMTFSFQGGDVEVVTLEDYH
jgi:toxin HigB-1